MEIRNTYAIKRNLNLTNEEAAAINAAIGPAEKLYNLGVTHYTPVLKAILATPGLETLDKYSQYELLKKHGLTDPDMRAWFTKTAEERFAGEVDKETVGKLAGCLFASAMRKLRSPKFPLCYHAVSQSFFDKNEDVVLLSGMRLKPYPVNENDHYLRAALETGKVVACTIGWVIIERTGHVQYQANIIFEGEKPQKQPAEQAA